MEHVWPATSQAADKPSMSHGKCVAHRVSEVRVDTCTHAVLGQHACALHDP